MKKLLMLLALVFDRYAFVDERTTELLNNRKNEPTSPGTKYGDPQDHFLTYKSIPTMKMNFRTLVVEVLIAIIISLTLSNCGNNERDEELIPPAPSLKEIAPEATVSVVANYFIKFREMDLWLTPNGSTVPQQPNSEPFGCHGTGTFFSDGESFRILTARHVVDASVSSLIKDYEGALGQVAQILISRGWPQEDLVTEQGELNAITIANLAEYLLEVEPCPTPGYLIPAGTSSTEYKDEMKQNSGRTPSMGIPYTRNQLGLNDFAVLTPKQSVLSGKFKSTSAFKIEDLANHEDLDSINNSSERKVFTFGFPNQLDYSFDPQDSYGNLIQFDGEQHVLTFDKNVRPGSSGSAIIYKDKIIGIISGFSDADRSNVIAVPTSIIAPRLRQEFKK